MTAQRDDRWLVAIVAAFVLQSEKKKSHMHTENKTILLRGNH
jgi:hypothetical protein